MLIYTFIYLSFYGNNIIYCMTENDISSTIAEAKEPIRPSQQVIALRRNIHAYAGSQIQLLETIEQQTAIIEEQKTEIIQLKKNLFDKGTLLDKLDREINGEVYNRVYRRGGYISEISDLELKARTAENKISRLTSQIADLKKDLENTETLYSEAKSDKNRLYRLLEDALRKK